MECLLMEIPAFNIWHTYLATHKAGPRICLSNRRINVQTSWTNVEYCEHLPDWLCIGLWTDV